MRRSASTPGSEAGSGFLSGRSLDLLSVERELLPLGVNRTVAARMRLDATSVSPAMLDLRMNYRNLLNEMNLHGGRVVSHQYSLMKPRRKNIWEKPKELECPEGRDPVIFRSVARKREKEKRSREAAARKAEEGGTTAASEDVPRCRSLAHPPHARAVELEDRSFDDGGQDTMDEEGALPAAARDPTAALEVQELMNDVQVRETFVALQDLARAEWLPRSRLNRALEALGFVDADQATIKATLRALPGYDTTIPDGFTSLAYDEFCAIVVAVSNKRQQLLKEAFVKLDRDQSGTISKREFRHLLWDLGFTVSDSTVESIFTEVDTDKSGQVELGEFEEALRILHERHGFTREEAAELFTIFDRYDIDKSGEMSANELASALGWFGAPTTIRQAKDIIRKFDQDSTATLCRCEFLMVMRWRLEDELSDLRSLFAEVDQQCKGALTGKQLAMLFHRLGYTIPHEVLQESIKELGPASTIMGIVFEDVCRLLHTIRRREGFSKTEVSELMEVYRMCDKGGEGRMKEFELAHALNMLGYPVSHARRRKLWCDVDVDKNGHIDEGEFLKLARLLREGESAAVQSVLDNCIGCARARDHDVKDMFAKLGYTSRPEVLAEALKMPQDSIGDGCADLLGLLTILRFVRENTAETIRATCGLPEPLAERIREKFKQKLDAGRRIDGTEFERFMYDLFRQARTSPVEREKIKRLIKDHTEECTLSLKQMFWVVRLYNDSVEEDRLAVEQATSLSCGFSEQQVAQFRAAFVEADADGSGDLSEPEIVKLFNDVAAVDPAQVALLHSEINNLGSKRDHITFSEFLRILGNILSGSDA